MVRGEADHDIGSQTESKKSSISKMPSANVQKGSRKCMKPTSSSDSRKNRLQVSLHSSIPADEKTSQKNLKILDMFNYSQSLPRNSRLKLLRSSTKKSNSYRATCSSTLKDKKFAEASVVKVCPYAYCQLHGHKHEPVPSLSSFLSSRRRLLKTQKSMKLRELSPLRMGNAGTRVLYKLDFVPDNQLHNDFFVENHAEPKARGGKTQNYHEKEELLEAIFLKDDNDATRMQESYTVRFEEDGDRTSDLSIEMSENFHDYVGVDQKVETGRKDGQQRSLTEGATHEKTYSERNYRRDENRRYLESRNDKPENCDDGQDDTSTKQKETKSKNTYTEIETKVQGRSSRTLQLEKELKITETLRSISKLFAEDCIKENDRAKQKSRFIAEEIKRFSLRPPQFHPMEPDPKAEKVDLRHQMMDERKATKEWMIDYAIRKVVKRLAPSRKRKVELLVEAFETVITYPMCENSMQDTEDFAHSRSTKACS